MTFRKTRPPPAEPPAPPVHSRFGDFVLVDRIAVGGMAEVFRALAPQAVGAPRVVVVKRMLPSLASEADAQAMFHEEARLGSYVRHSNVVNVLQFGEERGLPFIALEFVRGVDLWRLGRWLRRTGRSLDLALSLYIVRELLAGLDAVHEARDETNRPLGIVHRDVSPSNVLVSVHGDVKLADFGIARSLFREAYPQAPMNERAKGKLGYLAPEQVAGAPCDRRADVFSAGVIAAELFMGRPLFSGGSELAVLLAIRDAKVQPFLEAMSALPKGLGELIVRALARSVEDRFRSAREFNDTLSPYQTENPATSRQRLAELIEAATQSAAKGSDTRTTQAVRADHIAKATTPPTPTPTADATTPRAESKAPSVKRGDPSLKSYTIKTVSGKTEGPYLYAKVVELVATGHIGVQDWVSIDDSPFQAIEEITDLARHLPPSSTTSGTSDAPREADEVLSLQDAGIVRILARTALRSETGLLLCELGEVRKEVYIRDGTPEFVTSNLASELLGEYLVSNGGITRGELDMALAVMPRFEGRLGDTLVALGLVEPVQLFQHIANQVRTKLLDLFLWTSGTASFYKGVSPPASGFPLGLDPWKTLVSGVSMRLRDGLDNPLLKESSNRKLETVDRVFSEYRTANLPMNLRAVLDHLQSEMTPLRLFYKVKGFNLPELDEDGFTCTLQLLFHLGVVRWSKGR